MVKNGTSATGHPYMDSPMERARVLRLARSVHDEVARALQVESYGTPGNGGECAFKMSPVGDGVEMDYAMDIGYEDGAHRREVVRVTVRTLELF